MIVVVAVLVIGVVAKIVVLVPLGVIVQILLGGPRVHEVRLHGPTSLQGSIWQWTRNQHANLRILHPASKGQNPKRGFQKSPPIVSA